MEKHTEAHDIIIIGAGLSGINTAHILREQLPHRSFIILEARDVLGGTWRFFRYPGLRSDSNMSSFALKWHPWPHNHRIASGPEISQYLEDAAKADGTIDKILFRHRVTACEWRSNEQRWTLDVDASGVAKTFSANIIMACSGYYSYEKALETVIPGIDKFAGQVVHPQWWPEGLDYSGKRIVIIGSGATTITLVPTLAKEAGHVTMLQRSPTYIAPLPSRSILDTLLRFLLPLTWALWILRLIEITREQVLSQFALANPGLVRFVIRQQTKWLLPKHIDVDVHFRPRYKPLQQRICFAADGDFFQALHRDNCEIVTEVIETVKEDGIVLKSGRFIPADMIVTATGLHFELLSGVIPIVDGKPIVPGSHYAWRGCMLDSLPNLMLMLGYVETTWTPGVDTMARLAVRVIKQMEQKGATNVMPEIDASEDDGTTPLIPATSTYFVTAVSRTPKTTGKGPWYGRKGLLRDLWALLWEDVEEGLVYGRQETKKMI